MKKTILLCSLLATPLFVFAAKSPSDFEAQLLNEAKQKYQKSDKQLNEVYQDILKSIELTFKDYPDLKNNHTLHIKSAQRAWITFRDANCNAVALKLTFSPEAWNTNLITCKDILTKLRTDELKVFSYSPADAPSSEHYFFSG